MRSSLFLSIVAFIALSSLFSCERIEQQNIKITEQLSVSKKAIIIGTRNRIRQRPGGYSASIVVNDATGITASSATLQLTSPPPDRIPENISFTYHRFIEDKQSVILRSGLFEAGEKIVGQELSFILTVFDAKGNPLAKSNVKITPEADGQLRIRKRPDILQAEWDELIDESVELLKENPLALTVINPTDDPSMNPVKGTIVFEEPFEGPWPIETEFPLTKVKSVADGKSMFAYSGLMFEEKAFGYDYKMTATFYNSEGEVIGIPETFSTSLVRADFRGRIKRIRIKERTDGRGYRIIGVQTGDYAHRAAKVRFQFSEPFDGAIPTQTTFITDARTDVEDTANAKAKWTSNLDFEGDPSGGNYSITATMFGWDGEAIGSPVTLDVAVESTSEKPAGELTASRIFKTKEDQFWTVTAEIKWADDVEPDEAITATFIKFGGPTAKPTEFKCNLLKFDPDTRISSYKFSGVSFDGDPTGSIYELLFTYGRGTRGTASSSSTKTELL